MSGARALLDGPPSGVVSSTQATGSKYCFVMLHRQIRSGPPGYSVAQEAGQCLAPECRLRSKHKLQCSTADLS